MGVVKPEAQGSFSVIFKVLDPAILVENPHHPEIQGHSQPVRQADVGEGLSRRGQGERGRMVGKPAQYPSILLQLPLHGPRLWSPLWPPFLPPHCSPCARCMGAGMGSSWTCGARVVPVMLSLPAAMSLPLSLPPTSPVSPHHCPTQPRFLPSPWGLHSGLGALHPTAAYR